MAVLPGGGRVRIGVFPINGSTILCRPGPRAGSSDRILPARGSRGSGLTRHRKIVAVAACLAPLVLADVAISVLFLRDGIFLGNPLPPFETVTHPRQRAWIEGLAAEDPSGIGAFDPELGWTWRPSSRTADGAFTIDALGARGPREYAPRPPAGVTRVLTFGDSFTFCDEMPDDSTFEHYLEDRHRDFEVLNFGVSGYGTDQALLRYRSLGRGLGADVVCIGILLENIGRNVNRYRPLWNTRTGFPATKPRFVLAAGELRLVPQPYRTKEALLAAVESGGLFEDVAKDEYWWRRPPVPTGRLSSLVRIACGYLAQRERSPARLWRDVDGEPFQVTLAILETFQREALADGARLAPILVFPAREDLRDHAVRGDSYWEAFYAELDRRGLAHLDLIAPLLARYREEAVNPEGGTVYYKGHLSTVGNSVVADVLHAYLAERLE